MSNTSFQESILNSNNSLSKSTKLVDISNNTGEFARNLENKFSPAQLKIADF